MKKLLMVACAIALCLGCFGLSACGNGSGSNDSSSSEGSSSSSAAEDPTKKFVGEWKMAAAEGEGITFTGDFGAMVGSEDEVALSLKEDGTGSLAVDANVVGLTWEMDDEGEDTILLTADSSFVDLGLGGGKVSEDKKSVIVEGKYRNEMLALDLGTADYATDMIFTHDGTIAGLPALTGDVAEAVPTEEALVGTWILGGVNMNGMMLYGNPRNLAALVGSEEVALTIAAGGTATIMGKDTTYTVGDEGATLIVDDAVVAMKTIEGDLILEFSEDDAGIPMVMRFAKQ